MKKNYLRSFLFSSFLILGVHSMNGQEKKNDDKLSNETGKPRMIVLKKYSNFNLSQSKSLLQQELKLSANDDFRILKTESDKLGFTHQKQQQYYKNIKVEFGTYSLHAKSGRVASLNGEYYAIKELNIRPQLSKQAAFQRALAHTGAEKYLWEYPEAAKEMDNYKKPEGELLILPGEVIGKKEPRLAYKFDIYATKPVSRGYLYIDAKTGEALFFNAIIKHATTFGHVGKVKKNAKTDAKKALESMLVSGSGDTRYSGTQTIETTFSSGVYTLNDATRKVYTRDAKNQAPGTTYPYISNYDEFTDNDNNWTSAEHSANKDNAALVAHWGAMKTFDYFNTVHNRNSYDGNGAQIRSYVHVDSNYDNAFWNGSVMSYGDGSSNGNEGNGFFDALTSIDVAAHEIGHAVCSNTADLAYQRESGGLNEGFSDIWGAAVEHFAKGNGNDSNPDATIWLIGDEIDRRNGSAALRSMSNPTSLGQPDTYGGTNWINPQCGTPTRTNDYCGVHTNSGVLNYWFYILTVGGSGTNDIGNAFSVSGIGMSKAANISYRLEATYLSANSTFQNARDGAIQAAADLYGANGAEVIAVTNAWHAVGVGSAYGQTSYCDSKGNSVSDEYIGRVQLGTIDNSSNGNNGYTDHTAIATDLVKGSTATITVTPVWTGTLYNEGYSVWIDYNQDGDFEDAGEQIFTAAASQTTPVNGTFTVPSSATDGTTRMRVSMKYNGIPTSCETFSYGEVEDYTINIGASGGDTVAPSAPTSLAVSAITETTATLNWTASTDNVGVTGYDVYQGTTNLGTVTSTSANITGLTTNTSYTFSVKAKDAAGNESLSSNSVTFTTGAGADTQAPSAPSSLLASNTTQTTVDLSWTAATDNVGVTGYDIFQGSTNIGTVTGTTTNVTGLTANTAYSFYVVAKDAAGNTSSASNTVNVTTSANSGGSSQVLFDGSFETGWEGWVDGGSDSFRYSGSRSYDGNYSIRLRDNSGTASSMTLGAFNVSSYDNIEIVFYFYAYSMENGEDFWVQYNNGSGWNTVASYARGTNFNNNTFYTATVNISSADYTFPSNAQFRFRCDASANGDQVYIDKVKITATSGSGSFAPNSIADLGGTLNGVVGSDTSDNGLEIDGLQVSPNPASHMASLKAELDLEDENAVDVRMNMYNVQGRLIRTKKWENVSNSLFEKDINVSNLPGGVYFVNIQTSNGFTQTQKLIVN